MTEKKRLPLNTLLKALMPTVLTLLVLAPASPAHADARILLQNAAGSLCLAHSEQGQGPAAELQDCQEAPHRIWEARCDLASCSSSAYRLSDLASGLCYQVALMDNSLGFGPCSSVSQLQKWYFAPNPNGGLLIQSPRIGLCLEATETGQGPKPTLTPCHFGASQRWKMIAPHPV